MTIVLNPRALQDAAHHAAYLKHAAGSELARRFLDCFRETVDNLARMPGIGSPYPLKRSSVKLRCSAIRKFRRHFIFYREFPDGGIEVMRLLHSAQDMKAILEEDT